jgi:hypothetical protein
MNPPLRPAMDWYVDGRGLACRNVATRAARPWAAHGRDLAGATMRPTTARGLCGMELIVHHGCRGRAKQLHAGTFDETKAGT